MDIAEHRVAGIERQLGNGGAQLLADLWLQLGVCGEGHLQHVVDGRLLVNHPVARAVRREAVQIVLIYAVDKLLEFVFDLLAVSETGRSGHERLDSGIECMPRPLRIAFLIQPFSGLELLFSGLHSLVCRGFRLCGIGQHRRQWLGKFAGIKIRLDGRRFARIESPHGRGRRQKRHRNRGSGTAMSRQRVRTQKAMYKLKDA